MTQTYPTAVAGPAWREYYQQRVTSAEAAIAHVQPGNHVWISLGQQVGVLVAALIGRALEAPPITLSTIGGSEDLSWYTDEIAACLRLNVRFASAFSRGHVNDFRADFTPWWVWGDHKAIDEGRPGNRPIDVALVRVSPPNKNGYCCFGNVIWDVKTTAERAKTVIAVVSDNVLRTFGDSWIHVSAIDWFVEHTEPRTQLNIPVAEPAPWLLALAENVAALVHDGDTVQFGTGSTTGGIVRAGAFDRKHDLGYFAELTVPGTVDLARHGVITSRRANVHPGKFVTTMAAGSADENDFIDGNPMFEFYATDYIHNPACIARNDNLVAINNALSVDLTGQIAAGQVGSTIWSGTGGQLAFALGAFMSRGGRSITVLPATAAGGAISRIVPQFGAGQIVTVPRDIADIIVTEYGVAHLLNKTQRERAEELIAVAHPDFRGELRQQAARLVGL
jgi:4-hydroxybutyrate CoA-transferase